MLLSIDIRNFAIIQSLQLDWNSGMSVITGETGAGKSIVIDALGLCLGNKAEQSVITAGARQSEINALFEVSTGDPAFDWLQDNDLLEDECLQNISSNSIASAAKAECILRRVIVKDGRSKCYINGRNVAQSQLRALGNLLVDIHGQHAQQTLLKNKEQLNLVDRYANHSTLLENVKNAYHKLRDAESRKNKLHQEKVSRDAKRELLSYQVEELELANPEQSILNQLESEHLQAATSQDRLLLAESALLDLNEDETTSCLTAVGRVITQLNKLTALDKSVEGVVEILTDAESLVQEAQAELSQYRDQLNCNPENLDRLERQLMMFHDLARKHHVSIKELPSHFIMLKEELNQIQADDQALEQIQFEYDKHKKRYIKQANILTKSRKKSATKLSQLITTKIQNLAMDGGVFSVQVNSDAESISVIGQEEVEFLVSANPGQPMQPLNKVASGGELSRISLAIAVITSEQQLIPCVIFDEVDVGIGGATAETVGSLLKQLADKRQIICVTHQPQVASCGDNHYIANKTKQQRSTSTEVFQLNKKQRVEEVARMLGGKIISDKTISHAKEMLNFN